jgi:lipopolysaccharide export system permease protein
LNYTLDSLNKNLKTDIISFSEIATRIAIPINKKIAKKRNHFLKISCHCITLEQQSDILKIAVSNQTSIAYSIESTKLELETNEINKHLLAFYDKFCYCICLFSNVFHWTPLELLLEKEVWSTYSFAILIFITFFYIHTLEKD